MKLSEFTKINRTHQLNSTDYLVIFSYQDITERMDRFINVPNVFPISDDEGNVKFYWVVLRKGLYSNFINHWKECREGNKKIKAAPKQGEVFFINYITNLIDVLVYDSLEDFIEDCDVYSYPKKIEFDISNGEMLKLLKLKKKNYTL